MVEIYSPEGRDLYTTFGVNTRLVFEPVYCSVLAATGWLIK